MYVCMYVCVYVYMYVWMYVCVDVCKDVCNYVCINVCTHICYFPVNIEKNCARGPYIQFSIRTDLKPVNNIYIYIFELQIYVKKVQAKFIEPKTQYLR